MTMPSENYKDVYIGTGAVSVYPYTFRIFADTDLEVSEILIATAVETPLVLTTDYTVSGAGDAGGGNVTLVSGNLPATKKLVIKISAAALQLTNLIEHGSFSAEVVEAALDKQANISKSLKEIIARSIVRPTNETTPLVIPALVSGGVLSNNGSIFQWISGLTATNYNGTISAGTDASKSASPAINDIHIATDTRLVYMCFIATIWTIVDGAGVGPDMKNLVVVLNTGTPASLVDIDADNLQVEEYNLASINLTADITASGANGLDAGAEAGDTWYSVWVIYNPSTNVVASLLSASETSPTLPSGYTAKRKVGHVRNGASSNFNDNGNVAESFGERFHDRGDPVSYDFIETDLTLDDNWHDLNLSSIVPDGARSVLINLILIDNANNRDVWFRKNGNSNSRAIAATRTQVANLPIFGEPAVACDSDRVIEYLASSDIDSVDIAIIGWYR